MEKAFELANNLFKNTTVFLSNDGIISSDLKELIDKKEIYKININYIDFTNRVTVKKIIYRLYAFIVQQYEYFMIRKYMPSVNSLVNDIITGELFVLDIPEFILWSIENNVSFKRAQPLISLEDLQIDIETVLEIFTSAFQYKNISGNNKFFINKFKI